MGASSSKRAFFWQKKSPLERTWARLQGALSNKKSKRKRTLEKVKPGNLKNKFKKRFSLTDKKEPQLFKRVSLGNMKKGARASRSQEERRGSQRERNHKEEKTLKKGEGPSRLEEQDAKKTEKSEGKRPKIVWRSR